MRGLLETVAVFGCLGRGRAPDHRPRRGARTRVRDWERQERRGRGRRRRAGALRRLLGLAPGVPRVDRRSTHRGEEPIVLDVHARLRGAPPGPRPDSPPRPPERVFEVERSSASGAPGRAAERAAEGPGRTARPSSSTRWASWPSSTSSPTWCSWAEAWCRRGPQHGRVALRRKPALFVPTPTNFRESAELLAGSGGGSSSGTRRARAELARLLGDPAAPAPMGDAGLAAVAAGRARFARRSLDRPLSRPVGAAGE